MMQGLYAAVLGMSKTTPLQAGLLAERAQFVMDHPAYTLAEYDRTPAGDIAFQRAYETMIAAAQAKALREAEEKLKHD